MWPQLIAAGASLLGGAMGADAAGDAAKAQTKAAREQMAFQRWLYEQQAQRSEPWRQVGQGSLNQLAQLFGTGYTDYAPPNYNSGYGSGGYSPGGSQTVGRTGLGDPLNLPDPLGIFGKSGRTATFGPGTGATYTAKNVLKMMKQGMSIGDIAKLGRLETSLNPRRLKKLTKAGLDAEEILQLQQAQPQGQPGEMPAGYHAPVAGGDMSVFQMSPDYQFRKTEGMKGIENSAAARGGAFSGNALRALNDFNSNLASGEFGDFVNRRLALAGMGQVANSNQGSAGNAFGAYGGQAINNMGDARASGIATQGNIWGNAIGGAANAFGYYQPWNRPQQNSEFYG